MPRPTGAYAGTYAGTYHNSDMGSMHWQAIAGAMGVAHARAEIFDAAEALFRITLTGGGTVATLVFEDEGPASAVHWSGFKFDRKSG